MRAAGQGARPARSDHPRRPRRDDFSRRVRSSQRILDQRPHARRPIPRLVSQSDRADHDRRVREIPRLRDDPGIGPVYAKKLVRAFGEMVFEVIEQEPSRGVVSRIDTEEGELSVDFDGREVTYGFAELDELVLAYATTIHKSQGSEYPAVVIPLSTQHYSMLERNLVYTGVTRSKRLVVLVGQRKALAIAVKGARARRRWSKLREWLAV